MRNMSRHVAAAILSVCLPACAGAVGDVPTGPHTGPSTGADDGPRECAAITQEPVGGLLRLSNHEYRNVVSDLIGSEVDPGLFAAWTPVAEVYGFDTMSETRIDARALDEQLRTSEKLAELVIASRLTDHCPARPTPEPPAEPTALTWDNCGKAAIERLASRGFRRPLRGEELDGYRVFFEARLAAAAGAMPHPFFEALLAVTQSVLLSPHLVFKPELLSGGFDDSESSYRVASRLSFYARGSIPDDQLWEQAALGRLGESDAVREQLARLLQDYQSRFRDNFAAQWLGFRQEPPASEPLLISMRNESRDVFATVFSEDLPPASLLSPGFTVVDEGLAAHYGLSFDQAGPSTQRIPTDARGGLLSQGYFLKRTANGSDFRRAIHRGLWTLTRLLCREMPRLDAATLEEISQSLGTIDRSRPLSEQMAIHRTSGERCISCHGQIDPVGLALEKYDEQGKYREIDGNGHPIKSELELFGQPVSGPDELSSAIAASEEYRACIAEKTLTFALSRGPSANETCLASRLVRNADGSEASVREMALDALLMSLEMVDTNP